MTSNHDGEDSRQMALGGPGKLSAGQHDHAGQNAHMPSHARNPHGSHNNNHAIGAQPMPAPLASQQQLEYQSRHHQQQHYQHQQYPPLQPYPLVHPAASEKPAHAGLPKPSHHVQAGHSMADSGNPAESSANFNPHTQAQGVETYYGYIETVEDAIIIVEACRLSRLPRVKRRLNERERSSIRSGGVFAFVEKESGIRRWTDGKVWSPSRICGEFLLYRELDQRLMPVKKNIVSPYAGINVANAAATTTTTTTAAAQSGTAAAQQNHSDYSAASSISSRSNASDRRGSMDLIEEASNDSTVSLQKAAAAATISESSGTTSTSNSSSRSLLSPESNCSGNQNSPIQRRGSDMSSNSDISGHQHSAPTSNSSGGGGAVSVVNNSSSSYPNMGHKEVANFKRDGLVKKTISLSIGSETYHLVCYFKESQLANQLMTLTPSRNPALAKWKLNTSDLPSANVFQTHNHSHGPHNHRHHHHHQSGTVMASMMDSRGRDSLSGMSRPPPYYGPDAGSHSDHGQYVMRQSGWEMPTGRAMPSMSSSSQSSSLQSQSRHIGSANGYNHHHPQEAVTPQAYYSDMPMSLPPLSMPISGSSAASHMASGGYDHQHLANRHHHQQQQQQQHSMTIANQRANPPNVGSGYHGGSSSYDGTSTFSTPQGYSAAASYHQSLVQRQQQQQPAHYYDNGRPEHHHSMGQASLPPPRRSSLSLLQSSYGGSSNGYSERPSADIIADSMRKDGRPGTSSNLPSISGLISVSGTTGGQHRHNSTFANSNHAIYNENSSMGSNSSIDQGPYYSQHRQYKGHVQQMPYHDGQKTYDTLEAEKSSQDQNPGRIIEGTRLPSISALSSTTMSSASSSTSSLAPHQQMRSSVHVPASRNNRQLYSGVASPAMPSAMPAGISAGGTIAQDGDFQAALSSATSNRQYRVPIDTSNGSSSSIYSRATDSDPSFPAAPVADGSKGAQFGPAAGTGPNSLHSLLQKSKIYHADGGSGQEDNGDDQMLFSHFLHSVNNSPPVSPIASSSSSVTLSPSMTGESSSYTLETASHRSSVTDSEDGVRGGRSHRREKDGTASIIDRERSFHSVAMGGEPSSSSSSSSSSFYAKDHPQGSSRHALKQPPSSVEKHLVATSGIESDPLQ